MKSDNEENKRWGIKICREVNMLFWVDGDIKNSLSKCVPSRDLTLIPHVCSLWFYFRHTVYTKEDRETVCFWTAGKDPTLEVHLNSCELWHFQLFNSFYTLFICGCKIHGVFTICVSGYCLFLFLWQIDTCDVVKSVCLHLSKLKGTQKARVGALSQIRFRGAVNKRWCCRMNKSWRQGQKIQLCFSYLSVVKDWCMHCFSFFVW